MLEALLVYTISLKYIIINFDRIRPTILDPTAVKSIFRLFLRIRKSISCKMTCFATTSICNGRFKCMCHEL